ncbi:MAG TPA: porin [Desulfohalobiaceae bacterium]|nr:porin [Desulfohalobiaceae bacterium]
MIKKNKIIFFISLAFLLTFLFFSQIATAQKTSVAEEILKILYDNGQISTKQYHTLLKKARTEQQRRSQQALKEAKQEMDKRNKHKTQKSPEKIAIPYWENGLHFDSQDESYKLQIGGRILNDWGYIDGDSDVENTAYLDQNDDFGSGTEIRQGRIYLKGTLHNSLMFKAQYDFAGGDVDFKDTWIGFKDIPYAGHLKIGHFKEPFSLEELTSRKYITFMERSLPGQAGRSFVPARNTGLMLYDTAWNKKMTWAVGGFRDTDGFGNGFGDNEIYNLTTRITGTPFYTDNGRKLVHLGLGYNHKWLENNATLQFRARPESHLTDDFVDTFEIQADEADILGPELAVVYGPFSLQGEYMQAFVDTKHYDDLNFKGYYLQGSYFLTGEHRNYKRSSGAFGRVKPKNNFDLEQGHWGAWETAFRYSSIDLDDESVDGGELEDFTAGLNWYLYPNLRIMFNYILADLEDIGDTNIFQSRFQLDF